MSGVGLRELGASSVWGGAGGFEGLRGVGPVFIFWGLGSRGLGSGVKGLGLRVEG